MKHFVVALLGVIVLSGLAPGSASATVHTALIPDAARPLDMQRVGNQLGQAPTGVLDPFTPAPALAAGPRVTSNGSPVGPDHEVFGFALASSLTDPTVGYPSWNFSLLSTVAFFGLHVLPDGTFSLDAGASVWNSSQLTGFISLAHSNGVKVVLTIILQDFSAGTPNMCAGLSKASMTIGRTVAEVNAKGVDGVNVDYEGLNGSCGTSDSSWARHAFTNFVSGMRSALPAGSYLSVDTYASSASDPLGFYDIAGLGPRVDSFFVMAYDLEYSNWKRPPLNCSSFCLGPTAPLTGYYYNDTNTAQQYIATVAASKVILGVPYYGRKACVPAGTANAYPDPANPSVTADTYLDAIGESTAAGVQPGSFATHRDANDPSGQERWDTWVNTTLNCTRELYWDDTVSLGAKYDLVKAKNLRGVGIWNLNYGGGAPELWTLLQTKFSTTTPWSSLGGVLTSGPDASSWGLSRVDVFVRGNDNGIWQKTWNGTAWTGWVWLGGVATADPTAVSWAANRIDLFVRGTDNGLWHRAWDAVGWHPWEALGGGLTSGPAVASWGAGRLDVFVRGNDNGLWHKWLDATGWHGWEALGGVLTSDPTVVSWTNRVDAFARGTDNALWHRWWDTAGWHAWERLGGVLSTGPDASSCAVGHIDVFAAGTDTALYQLGFNGTAWGAWQRLGGRWTTDPGAVCPPATTGVNLFDRGSDAALWATTVTGS